MILSKKMIYSSNNLNEIIEEKIAIENVLDETIIDIEKLMIICEERAKNNNNIFRKKRDRAGSINRKIREYEDII